MQSSFTVVAALTAALCSSGVGASPYRAILRRDAVPNTPGYESAGCYTEATSSRALTGSSYFDDNMTIEKCFAACSGFKYFGAEYGREV